MDGETTLKREKKDKRCKQAAHLRMVKLGVQSVHLTDLACIFIELPAFRRKSTLFSVDFLETFRRIYGLCYIDYMKVIRNDGLLSNQKFEYDK